tara:strand:- start:3 stop:299 length:297 start_codon:yes stop_codon:yes gene_type:complete
LITRRVDLSIFALQVPVNRRFSGNPILASSNHQHVSVIVTAENPSDIYSFAFVFLASNNWKWIEKGFTLITIPEVNHLVHRDVPQRVSQPMVRWLKSH